jgi:hypothetical protein
MAPRGWLYFRPWLIFQPIETPEIASTQNSACIYAAFNVTAFYAA